MDNMEQNKVKLAELVMRAMGERSVRRYSVDTGVSSSHISRMLRQELKAMPSPDVIAKLTKSPDAKPRGGVTYEEMMVAVGYQDDAILDHWVKDFFTKDTEKKDDNSFLQVKEHDFVEYSSMINEERKDILRFKAISKGIIYDTISRRVDIQMTLDGMSIENYTPDTFIFFKNIPFKAWAFDCLYVNEQNKWERYKKSFTNIIGNYILHKPDPQLLTSIITNSKPLFDYFCSLSGKIAYRGNLTMILIDTDTLNVVDEGCISVIDDNYQNQLPMLRNFAEYLEKNRISDDI